MPRLQTLIALCCLSFAATAQERDPASNFYKDKERGWFWHETVVDEVEPEPTLPAPVPQPTQAPETVELSAEWIKDALPKLQMAAMNSPTKENLAALAYAQRLMLDMANRMSSRMAEFMMDETPLDENARRPTSGFALSSFQEERQETINVAMTSIQHKMSGLFFFYASDCPYCHKMIPVLREFKRRHKVDILAVSLDGGIIAGMEDFQIVNDADHGVSSQFGVALTPTIELVLPDKSSVRVSEGLKSLPDLEDRLLLAARRTKILDEDMYAATRSVREISVLRSVDGNLIADKQRLESDPAYLAELLRSQLDNQAPQGTPVKGLKR